MRSEMVALLGLGNVEAAESHLQKAVEVYHQALDIAESVSDLLGKQTILLSLGGALLRLGRQNDAISSFREAETIARCLRDDRAQKLASSYLANMRQMTN